MKSTEVRLATIPPEGRDRPVRAILLVSTLLALMVLGSKVIASATLLPEPERVNGLGVTSDYSVAQAQIEPLLPSGGKSILDPPATEGGDWSIRATVALPTFEPSPWLWNILLGGIGPLEKGTVSPRNWCMTREPGFTGIARVNTAAECSSMVESEFFLGEDGEWHRDRSVRLRLQSRN